MKRVLFSAPSVRRLLLAALACLSSPAPASDRIQIVTEELPPYNMTEDGRLTGMSTEVVQAVLEEVGVQANIQSMPWARAYDIALNSENVLIYSIARTRQREQLFKWVGIVAPMRWHLYSLPQRNIQLRRLDDARRYQIATVKQDAGEQHLLARGFAIGKNLQSSNKYAHNYEKLTLGRVDLWIANELNARYLARRAGAEVPVPVLSLPDLADDDGLSMAFSLQTSDALVERFRQGLKTVRDNGTYATIAKRWL
ncbi:substrate-binding periplasmic protein [Pseudomonas sp. MBLB4136]|uniref:substrate-binding periplasmic protein n=1 Tax=Pseudomonas sp. MBLB4136 TaxID=3451558 RepID=UPI003F74F5F1